MGFTSKSFLGLFRNVSGSLYGSNSSLQNSVLNSSVVCHEYEDHTLILANVVCLTNSLSAFQFNSLFFIYSSHKYCVMQIKELNGHDPLKRKNLCVNLQFPLQGFYVEIIWCFIWSLFYIDVQIHTEIFYIPYVREVLYCKNEMCEGRWSFVSPWWMQIFLHDYKWKRETTWQI